MRRVNVLAFGVVKDIFGHSSIEIEFDNALDAGSLKLLLENRYPRLKQLSSFMIAVNNEYASMGDVIKDSDEIAIIPPVSGG
jgi:molybdopterin converting factor subunit 1